MRIGVAHHLGWAALVTADEHHRVVDRRRIELLGPGLPVAPVHHEGGPHELHRSGPVLDDAALARLVTAVRDDALRTTGSALTELAASVSGPVESFSVRAAGGVPADIALRRRAPHESRADSVMYLEVLMEVAESLGWPVHRFDAATVEADARAILGERADEVLHGPRRLLGAPWSKDHRMALAATVVAASAPAS